MVLVLLHGESGAVPEVAHRRTSRTSTRRGVVNPRVALLRPCRGKRNSAHRKAKGERQLQFATWNVRSLGNVLGPIETAFARGVRTSTDVDDRRIDIVISELKRLGIEVAGLQETRWFW